MKRAGRLLKRVGSASLQLTAALLIAATVSCGEPDPPHLGSSSTSHALGVKTVFVIAMENRNWSQLVGNAKAPYLNQLLADAAHAEQYYNPHGVHPSEPNYLWLEAGDRFGIADDKPPAINSQATSEHLVSYLERAKISWRSYQEDIAGDVCPLAAVKKYAPKHDPFVFFDDVTGKLDPHSQHCIEHIRPLTELATDLTGNANARYNFITPNLCHAMHDCDTASGDAWLSEVVGQVLASDAFKHDGALFLLWEEGTRGSDGPVGFLLLSPRAKHGYAGHVRYDHSSLLKTLQEIFDVKPLLRHAADLEVDDLSDLFAP